MIGAMMRTCLRFNIALMEGDHSASHGGKSGGRWRLGHLFHSGTTPFFLDPAKDCGLLGTVGRLSYTISPCPLSIRLTRPLAGWAGEPGEPRRICSRERG